MKNKIYFLAYGFSLCVIWGFCFLSFKQANSYTSAIGIVFTFLSVYFLQNEIKSELTIKDKFFILLLPVIYDIALYFILIENYLKKIDYTFYEILFYIHLINPLNVGLIVLLLGLNRLHDLSKPVNIFIFSFITIFYSYFFYSDWRGVQFASQTENFNQKQSQNIDEESELKPHNYDIDITNFKFINSNIDTITLALSGKYLLIETWNETCIPCIRAMKELPDFYESIKNKVEVYYLYENSNKNAREYFEGIFNFKKIQDKNKIIIDIDQDLYKSLDINEYPYFLLFNADGKLIYYIRGYVGKEEIRTQILKHI